MESILVAYSDHILKPIILNLCRNGEPVTAQQIAEHSSVPVRTVQRSIERLLSKNEIVIVGGAGRRWGSIYASSER